MNISTTKPKREKKRLDQLLVDQGFFPTREKAQSALMAGLVRVDTHIWDKAGTKLYELPDGLEVLGSDCPYVSRGGLKLAGALQAFAIDPQARICLDVGASTGGFSDCLLQHGATKVYAVDVGHGQLDWKLRQDPRIISREKVNARYLRPEDIYAPDEMASLAVMDVSFISILKILPALRTLIPPDGWLISLIKPQFEAPPQDNRKGIVSDKAAHRRVLESIWAGSPESGWHLQRVIRSPITGKSGNVEFLGLFGSQAPTPALEGETLMKELELL